MIMDTDQRIKILVGDCLRAREACKTADDVWIGQLEGMREAALQIAADLEQAQRLAAAEKARHKAAMDRGHAEESEQDLRIKERRKVSAEIDKEIDRKKAALRDLYENVYGDVA
jgi:hypothetical protein